ncbi:unnamed protein product [Symbiodinium microadriaticum]|nr:unnamed protein product [Symbiodinium microadriaticum]
MGRLVALVRAHVGQWLVAGHLLTVGEATTQSGSEIDFAITSSAIAGLVQVELDWSAPHRLPEFSVKDAAENATLSAAGLWLRVESWLNATAKGGVKVSERAIQEVVSKLQLGTYTQEEAERFRAEILALLNGSGTSNVALEARLREHVKQAQDEHLAQDKQRYHEWMEGAMVKGMRPLYKAIRSHEQVLVRPFRNKEAALRPYLRHAQWQQIWKSQNTPVRAVVPELLDRAKAETARLPALTTRQVQYRIHCLPDKAPGVEGWNNRMLKQIPHEAVVPLTQLLNHVEATGLAPGQWRITKFAMLAKNQAIERPIGLCSVVYKTWLQTRYPLVQSWLQGYEKVAPWDSAVPGVTCLSVSIARVFKCEVAVATGRHRATLYLDLSTFYETLSHAKLIESAKILDFPSSVLNIALQIYRGGRIIDAEGNMGPISFTDRGLCAGLDSWIDDVTIDAEDKDPQRAAQKIVSLYRTVSAELGRAELQISTSKSAFVAATGVFTAATFGHQGIFTGEFLPVDNVYFGTDASGGPRGEDPRLRVVSWAVVAIRWHPEAQLKYTRLGTMTGTLQIGATVNDGESVALDQLAQRTNQAIQVAVDSKIAIKRVHIPNIEVTWTKGHLSEEQHGQKFGPAQAWAWAANLEADQVYGNRPKVLKQIRLEFLSLQDLVRPRSNAEGELPILHGRRVGAGVPRNVLLSLPKTLGFEWDHESLSGPLLEFLGKGQDRVAYMSQDMVLKLSQHSQKQEYTLAKLLPGVENVMVVLHDDKGGMQNIAMTCLCQQPVVKAVEVMQARGAIFSFRFLCHVGCILTWLWTQKLPLLDLGESNMGMEQASAAEAYPALRFFDLLSWQRQSKPDAKWHGYHALAQKVCPVHAKWIKAACSEVTTDAHKVFRLFAAECQGYSDRLVQAGVMVDGKLSPRQVSF